jgi:hypothetical protein
MMDQNLEFGGPDGPTVWTRMRSELRDWFRRHAESLAPAYEGAVELLANPNFPGRERFIAHAVRDIANGLVFALEPQRPGQRVQYEDALDKIEEEWKSPDSAWQSAPSATPEEDLTISLKVAQLIDRLVLAHRERRASPSPYKLLFQFLARNSPSPAPQIDHLVDEFRNNAKWFTARAHFQRDLHAPVSDDDLRWRFQAFEGAIFGMVGTYFAGTGVLDEILQRANR